MKSATVEKLHPGQEPEREAPALGFSIQQDLGGGQNIVLQTHLTNDVGPADLNAMLDKMSAAATRLKARHQLGGLVMEFEKERENFERMRADEARLRTDKEHEIAREEALLRSLVTDRDDVLTEGRDAHVASGRGNDYKPQGNRKSRINAADAAIAKQEARVKQLRDTLQAEVGNYEVTLGQWVKVMEKFEKDIALLKAVGEV